MEDLGRKNMSGHTPGPWEVGEPDKNGQAIVRNGFIEVCTCWHHSVGAIEKQMHHNARLIAAAPDSHEANLKTIAAFRSAYAIDDDSSDDWIYDELGSALSGAYFAARSAIAKATSSSEPQVSGSPHIPDEIEKLAGEW